ncbi:response regulator transcription factor [Anaerocolumna sp. MB42-C2]|uniref:response regulator transcription factor n=1 Tax=Anaerocolumna sp. MB42-C2 TaxID=3070997 RepID=UPI0027E213B3|nr:helix-turn-helix domain-containing protein [Anaerocolumna sp. MB42-C2]WMJ89747.1 helix-turn-helix domain-containing protein [Anaerocolumna sp. MB42-C2]
MSLNILLVDDDTVFREYVKEMPIWEKSEFVLKGEVKNAREALAFLLRHTVDIVLLDVSMPEINGVELSSVIADKYPAVAMVAISSYDDYDFVREILKNGACDYILKHRLTPDLLSAILDSIRTRLKNTSSWDAKKKLRQKTDFWLENGGSSPFFQNNCRKAVTIAEFSQMDSFTESIKDAFIEGILRIFEANSDDETDVLALFRPPNRFIVITCFYSAISEAFIQKKTDYNNLLCSNNINRIYHLSFKVHNCPLLLSDNAIRSYINHRIKEDTSKKQDNTLALSLTINQQKKLFSAIESRNNNAAALLIQEIFEKIPPSNYGLQMMVTKELLDLIDKVSVEYRLSLDFLPKGNRLFEYTKAKNPGELGNIISGLYTQVFREITSNEKDHKKYSEAVKMAMNYLQQNYCDPIGLDKTAKAVGLNSSYLSRVFHKETGVTVVDYLNQIRIEAVKGFLETNMPLKEIASRCGFQNYTYFLKTFKKYTGKTPKEYLSM